MSASRQDIDFRYLTEIIKQQQQQQLEKPDIS